MFGFKWPFQDEIGLAQARMEADKTAKKLIADECKHYPQTSVGYLIDCPFAMQWLKEPCEQCPKRNTKMTREEARKIVFNKCSNSLEGKEAGYLIDALEALGLLKFDQPKPVEPSKFNRPKEPSPVEKGLTLAIGSVGYERLTKWCKDHGYAVLRDGTKTDPQFAADAYPIENTLLSNPINMLKRCGYEIYRKDGTKA